MDNAGSRLFIALWPDDAVRAQLLDWRDGWHWPKGASPVRAERLHQTLHFLGDVERARIDELADALAMPFAPFTLSFGRNALWPHGVAVLEPDCAPPALLDLHARLGQVLATAGLPLDARPYKPHVTLARRASAATVANHGPVVEWHITRYALMRSAGGYAVLREYQA